jgi:mono/diheme cytochrome c family protein
MKIFQSTWCALLIVFGLNLFWVTGVSAEDPLERGAYLVRGIAACGNCHTPKGPEGDIPGMELAGMVYKDSEDKVIYQFPNITPDPETGVGGWTDAQLVVAIRQGIRPDGSVMKGIMPFELYRSLSDSDVNAIVAYMRSVPAVRNEISRTKMGEPLSAEKAATELSVASVSRDDSVAYGAYLAGPVGHCIECHTPGSHGKVDYANNLGAGGRLFPGPWGESISMNITPAGLSRWTDDELKTMITRGKRPDGSPMLPPMGYGYYANISDSDLDAIIAYLRSLPAK